MAATRKGGRVIPPKVKGTIGAARRSGRKIEVLRNFLGRPPTAKELNTLNKMQRSSPKRFPGRKTGI